MTASPPDKPTDAAIAEREKTKRTMIAVGAFLVLGMTALILFFQNIAMREGQFELDQSGFKFNLGQPITTSASVPTQTAAPFGNTVEVTTAPISSEDVPQKGAEGNSFEGRNLIDTAAGFVMSVDEPSKFRIGTKNSLGVRRITASDGSVVSVENIAGGSAANFEATVRTVVKELEGRGLAVKQNQESPTTTLIWYREDGKQYCVKIAASETSIIRATATILDSTRATPILKALASITPISAKVSLMPVGVEGSKRQQR